MRCDLHVFSGKRYRLLAQVTPLKFIMTVWPVFSDEMQPAGYSDLIKERRSEVGFNEALKKAPTTHAHPLSSISGASGGFVSLSDKHP